MLPHFGPRDVIGHVTIRFALGGFLYVVHWHQPSISHRYWDIMRHLLHKHIPILTALVTILRKFWGTLGVMPFFGKAPLAAAEGRRVRY